MAAAKFKVSDIAKRMNKSEKDVIFQLQSLGADITDAGQELAPDVIQALLTGKKLSTRTRSVIMREDKPQPEKKKEAVRPLLRSTQRQPLLRHLRLRLRLISTGARQERPALVPVRLKVLVRTTPASSRWRVRADSGRVPPLPRAGCRRVVRPVREFAPRV